jgi:hypothetical protein
MYLFLASKGLKLAHGIKRFKKIVWAPVGDKAALPPRGKKRVEEREERKRRRKWKEKGVHGEGTKSTNIYDAFTPKSRAIIVMTVSLQ